MNDPDTSAGGMLDETKECPFCAETIKARAIKCRYCGSDLNTQPEPPAERTIIGAIHRNLDEFKQQFSCPKCGSGMIDFRAKRKAGWGAMIMASEVGNQQRGLLDGLAMMGAASMINQQDMEYQCLACGKRDVMRNALNGNGPRRVRREGGLIEESTLRDGKAEGPYLFKTEDGRVVQEGTFKASKQHGLAVAYYESGAKKSERAFADGLLHGKALGWYEDGTHWFDEEYHYGKLTRLGRIWHPNGNLAKEGTYSYGKIHGEKREWYENGQLKHEGSAQNGVWIGEFRSWDEGGHLLTIERYGDAAGNTFELYWPNGQVRERGPLKNGKKHGDAEGWHEDGSPAHRITYANGKVWRSAHWNDDGTFQGERIGNGWVRGWKKLRPGEHPAPPQRSDES